MSKPAGWAFPYDVSDPSLQPLSIEPFCIQLQSPHTSDYNVPLNEISSTYALSGRIPRSEILSASSKIGVLINNKWAPGRTLTVAFWGGSATLRNRVQRFASEWMQFANIKFQFVEGRHGDVRVTFTGSGSSSSSYVGTDNMIVDKWRHTMELGIDDNSTDVEVRRLTLHEFGHVLGCVHEYTQPNVDIAWNRKAIIDAHRGVWDDKMVERNIVSRYAEPEVSASFDPHSIMNFPIPASWTNGTFSSNWNDSLSPRDQAFISHVYPFPSD